MRHATNFATPPGFEEPSGGGEEDGDEGEEDSDGEGYADVGYAHEAVDNSIAILLYSNKGRLITITKLCYE